jgi:hypothetical protein
MAERVNVKVEVAEVALEEEDMMPQHHVAVEEVTKKYNKLYPPQQYCSMTITKLFKN